MFGSSLDDLLPKINKRVAVVLFTTQYFDSFLLLYFLLTLFTGCSGCSFVHVYTVPHLPKKIFVVLL